MNEVDVSEEVESLVKMAAKAGEQGLALDALQLSQAACNAANAMAALHTIARLNK